MYVCICNALKDRQIKAEAGEVKSVGEVFRRCGTRPQCGKCLPDIARMRKRAHRGRVTTSGEVSLRHGLSQTPGCVQISTQLITACTNSG
jgi:bacterioferritin-associated ferredoxin